jgi:carbonic anhydrase
LDDLIEGYQRFRASEWPRQRERFEATADQGQHPHTMIIACSDSRVDPQMIFSARPGELFVVRNIANLVPPYEHDAAYHGTSAALEFGVRVLQVRRLVVLGHGMCGGIEALVSGSPVTDSDFLGHWIEIAAAVRERTHGLEPPEARLKACEEEVVRLSLANLETFPWIAAAVEAGRLSLHGAYFDIRHGVLFVLQADGSFAAADARPPQP